MDAYAWHRQTKEDLTTQGKELIEYLAKLADEITEKKAILEQIRGALQIVDGFLATEEKEQV